MDQKFCSSECHWASIPEWTVQNLIAHRGNKPRTYHLVKRDKHGGAEDVEWRKAIFERDNYTCQECGQYGGRLHAHHIKPYKDHPELRYDLSNGQTLCIPCHSKTETYGWSKYWHSRKK